MRKTTTLIQIYSNLYIVLTYAHTYLLWCQINILTVYNIYRDVRYLYNYEFADNNTTVWLYVLYVPCKYIFVHRSVFFFLLQRDLQNMKGLHTFDSEQHRKRYLCLSRNMFALNSIPYHFSSFSTCFLFPLFRIFYNNAF